jgi:beta-glucosidase
VGKTGYKPTLVDINAYTDNVGNVTITVIDIEKRADSILALMNLNEKVGQMVQVADGGSITSLFAGSFLKGSSYAAQQGTQDTATALPRKIPATIGTDYVHGGPMVYFPHNIGLGCSGDTLLTELSYRICAMCCKVGNNVDFAPCYDVPRNDKYGRVYEGWSETPDITKVMARASIRGLQGTDLSSDYSMIATAKHYAGAGGTVDGVMRGAASTGTWDQLCRIHLPAFHAAVDAGCASVMTSYNSFVASSTNNGQTNCTEHKVLITDTLKNGWGFDGFVISDWMQAYAPGWNPPINRAVSSVNAGLDVSMSPQDAAGFVNLVKGAAGGAIPQSRIDDAAKRCLRVKLRMGLFEKPLPNSALSNYFSSAEYRAVARACVRKTLVLLKNNNAALPLSKTAKIAVVGPWADNMGVQCGAWSETGGDAWQGSTTAHGIAGATTILQALQAGINAAGGGTVTYYANGTGIPNTVDKIVVVVGETPYAEDAGYKGDITLGTQGGTDQVALVQTAANVGKPVITILLTGRPNALGTIPNNSAALVAAWLPGTEGTGVADVLYGDYNFTGKLSITWPASNAQEPINTGNIGDANNAGPPLYTFGTGLTYP